MAAPKSAKDRRAEALARAIADPAFRRKLFANPEAVFGNVTAADRTALERMKKVIPALHDLVAGLASDILCGGGGCPGLA
jgi:hypothetical protein